MTALAHVVTQAPPECERARLALALRWAGEPLAPPLLRTAAAHLEECEGCRRIGNRLAAARWDDERSGQGPRIPA